MTEIAIADITVPEGRRPLDQAKVEQIAESFELVGQIAPIGLRRLGAVNAETSFERIKKLELVFGGHRLEAAKKLGWKKIDAVEIRQVVLVPKGCVETYGDYTKLVEITENLHRADLTTQQRNEQLALWVELYNWNRIRTQEQPNSKPGPKPNPGVVAAAKMTGRTQKGVKEAIKTTKVSPEVKEAADRAELSQRQRLAISRLPEAEQLDAIAKQAADPKGEAAQEKRVAFTLAAGRSDLSFLSRAIGNLDSVDFTDEIARMTNDQRIVLLAQFARAHVWLNKISIDIAVSGGATLGVLDHPSLRYAALSFMRDAITRIEATLTGRDV